MGVRSWKLEFGCWMLDVGWLHVSDLFSNYTFPLAMVTCFFKVPARILLDPLAILKSRFSKSGIGLPVMEADVSNYLMLLASRISPIHDIAALGYCEERVTCFSLEGNFPTSEFCRKRPLVNRNLFGFFLFRSTILRSIRDGGCILRCKQSSLRDLCVRIHRWLLELPMHCSRLRVCSTLPSAHCQKKARCCKRTPVLMRTLPGVSPCS